MNNELSIKQNNLPDRPTTAQTGKTNVNVNNQAGGTINFNYNFNYQQTADSSAETMIAIQSFSKEYYQLIVTCDENVFNEGVVSVSTNRALTKYSVPQEIFDRCSTLSNEGIEELKRFPAIICQENTEMNGVTSPNQFCIFAYIQKVMVIGKTVKIAVKPIVPIQQIKLCDKRNAVFFDLNMDCAITDLNHSAWSVHKVNVFDAFKEAGIPGVPTPV